MSIIAAGQLFAGVSTSGNVHAAMNKLSRCRGPRERSKDLPASALVSSCAASTTGKLSVNDL